MLSRLRPDSGPEHPTSSAAHTGLFPDAPVLRYELGGGDCVIAHEVPGGGLWQVAVHPGFDERFAACQVWFAVDGQPLLDQHGHGLEVVSCLVADQWNLLSLDLTGFTGAVDVHLLLPEGEGHGWLQPLGAVEVPSAPEDVVENVRTARGSHSRFAQSRGNTYPLACLPHGFTFVSPVSDARAKDWIFTWHPDGGPRLAALAFCHAPSPWINDRAGIQLMGWRGAPQLDPQRRAIGYDPRNMVDRPHLFRVGLEDGSVAEVTPTDHGAVFRFSWPDEELRCGVVVDLAQAGQTWLAERPDGRVEISGVVRPRQAWGRRMLDPVGYFWGVTRQRCRVIEGARPPRWNMINWSARRNGSLELLEADHLEIAMATSFISVEQARRNLELEIGESTFEEVCDRAHEAWSQLLGRLRINGADHDQLTTAYSNLARLHCWPNSMDENLGTADRARWLHASPFQAPATRSTRRHTASPVLPGTTMVNNGYWDTYRTCWPAYNLFTPDLAPRLTEGLLAAWRESGWMGRWSAPGHVDCMVGTSSDVIFADASRHGVAFDELAGYDSALRNACCPSPDPTVGRKGIGSGRFRGWIANDVHEGFSWSIENAICDAAIADWSSRLAERAGELGVPERADEFASNAVWFENRARSHRQLFDAATGFFQGRDRSGRPTKPPRDFDPAEWGGDFTETNAWGMSVSSVHDGRALAELHGGPAGLGDHLDRLFATAERADRAGSYGQPIHEMTEARALRLGQCGLSNQPAHHIAFMYAFTDRPWRTQEVVGDALSRLFVGSEIGQGYPGDEDNGEMSAWWLFAALGLYPLFPSSGEYLLTTPLFDWRFERPGGGLEVRAHGEGRHLERVVVDGQDWCSLTIPVERLQGEVLIEVWRAQEPCAFGAGTSPRALDGDWCADRSGQARVLLEPDRPASALVNDHGDVPVPVDGSTQVTLEWDEPVELRAITLTLAQPGVQAPELYLDGAEGRTLPPRTVRWPDQTVCWLLDGGRPVHVRRLGLVPSAGVLTQVECW